VDKLLLISHHVEHLRDLTDLTTKNQDTLADLSRSEDQLEDRTIGSALFWGRKITMVSVSVAGQASLRHCRSLTGQIKDLAARITQP
jgi:hypothetical protein